MRKQGDKQRVRENRITEAEDLLKPHPSDRSKWTFCTTTHEEIQTKLFTNANNKTVLKLPYIMNKSWQTQKNSFNIKTLKFNFQTFTVLTFK